ncbi:MAG: nucleotidyltransferase family protein [Chloroflexi bacterium]|nr:nucleotidyltransferase family protein [Chloroflexota bacterium]MCC6893300.1 nucleotidyltransferase family protein [Anaerolineae bacterium]
MFQNHISTPYRTIADFCQRYYIIKLSLFGSVLRDDFADNSDIDVLVEFDPAHIPGWEFVTMQDELSGLFGRQVDLHTYGSLSRHFRDKVVANAQVIYERV